MATTYKNKPLITEKGIYGFFAEYRWLSNFHETPIVYGGLTYTCTEGAYMAHKTLDLNIREQFTQLSPLDCKRFGRLIKLRPDWELLKLGVMLDVLQLKYSNPELRHNLQQTGNLYLEETNTWGDRYWGVCTGTGLNMMGHLTMAVREYTVLADAP